MILYLVQAFTDNPSGGNGAGVVLTEEGRFPSEKFMQATAARLNYSETAFLVPIEGGWRIRYFTPKFEVDLCGHATIASGRVLRESGAAAGDYIIETNAGTLRVTLGEVVMMDMAAPRLLRDLSGPEERRRLMQALGGDISMLARNMGPEIISAGLPDIIVPMRDEGALLALAPDMEALTALSEAWDCVGVHAFSLEKDCTARCRDFAPICGVPEESATGTASGALTHYLHRHGILKPRSTARLVQGESMGRPSEIITELHADGAIRVGGRAYILGHQRIFEG